MLDPNPQRAATVAELGQDANFEPECPPVEFDESVDRVVLGRLVTVVGSRAVERISPEAAAVPVSGLLPTRLAPAWPEGRPVRPSPLSCTRPAQSRRDGRLREWQRRAGS
jgi:hypothetical protein